MYDVLEETVKQSGFDLNLHRICSHVLFQPAVVQTKLVPLEITEAKYRKVLTFDQSTYMWHKSAN